MMFRKVNGFILENYRYAPAFYRDVMQFVHEKSGARVIVFPCDNPKKTMEFTFNTPVFNSKGITHIIEHCVFCGSKKYPINNPLKNLKGPNADWNASTYQGHTNFYFSSSYEKDFMNILDVYLDGIFDPLFLTEKRIFEGEGWHYTYDGNELGINGVVYSEMSRNETNKHRVIHNFMKKTAFKDGSFSYVSGGDIKEIPKLSYEEVIKYYKTYYHPGNCVVFIYGFKNVDAILEKLNSYFDRYDKFDSSKVRSYFSNGLKLDGTFEAFYPMQGDANEKNVLCFLYKIPYYDYVTEMQLDIIRTYLTTNGVSNLRENIVKTGLATSCYAMDMSTFSEKAVYFMFEGVTDENIEEVTMAYEKTLSDIAKNNFNCDVLRSIVENCIVYDQREDIDDYVLSKLFLRATEMVFSKSINRDLYDPDPELALRNMLIDIDKRNCEDMLDNFESFFISEKYARFIFRPDSKFASKISKKTKKRLSSKQKNFNELQLESIKEKALDIETFKARKNSNDDLACLPKFDISALPDNALWTDADVFDVNGIEVKYFKAECGNISSITFNFDLTGFSFEELQLVNIFTLFVNSIDTNKYQVSAFAQKVRENIQSMVSYVTFVQDANSEFVCEIDFETCKFRDAFNLVMELFKSSRFEDQVNLISKIKGYISNLHDSNTLEPVNMVLGELKKDYGNSFYLYNYFRSLEYENFLKELLDKALAGKIDLGAKLRRLSKKLYSSARLNAVVVSKDDSLKEAIIPKMLSLSKCIDRKRQDKALILSGRAGSTVILMDTLVNYVGISFYFGEDYTNNNLRLNVFGKILKGEYLEKEIRLRGGAYGVCVHFSKYGFMNICSYRDPNYIETLKVYDGICDFFMNFDGDIEDAIIKTFAQAEDVSDVYTIINKVDNMERKNVTREEYEEMLRELKKVTAEDVREFGKRLKEAKRSYSSCISPKTFNDDKSKERYDYIIEY